MTHTPRHPLVLRLVLASLRGLARIAPAMLRDDWLREWDAEVQHRWMELEANQRAGWRGAPDLIRRVAGALPDAVWMRRQFTADAEYIHDLRHGLRLLRRQAGFAIAAVATLAVGIGANTAVYSLVDTLMIRPLPYAGADRVMTVWQQRTTGPGPRDDVAPANFIDWRARVQSFTVLAAADPYSYDYTGGSEPRVLFAVRVTEGFFDALGVTPFLGRAFDAADYQPGRNQVVLLDHATWRAEFGGDSRIVGRALVLDDTPFTVIGVLPASFSPQLLPTAGHRGVWTPKVLEQYERVTRGSAWWNVVGRLKPGVSVAQAQAELDTISAQLAREYPRTNASVRAELVPLRQHLSGDVRAPFLLMFGAVIVVLTIACANVSALMLARSARRQREFAIRAALGAGRGRLVRQLLAESLIIVTAAAALGIVLARVLLRIVIALAPAGVETLGQVAVDGRVLAFTSIVAALTALLVAMAPALRLSTTRADSAMRERSAAVSHGNRGRAVLIVSEVALATVLLVSAGLLLRSFTRLLAVDPGFARGQVAVLQAFVYDRHEKPEQKRAFFDEALRRMRSVPGVADAGAASALPLIPANIGIRSPITLVGRPAPPQNEQPSTFVTIATPGYFDVLRIPVLAGRPLAATDGPSAPRVALVNDFLRRRHWPGGNPVGQRVSVRFEGKPVELDIVGVVGELRHDGLDRGARPELFVPFAQVPFGSMTFVVRTAGDAAAALPELKRQVWAIDPLQTFYQTTTMDALVSASVAPKRFNATIIGGFALIALVLAASGIYALISVTTAQRTQEIGVRLALGAQPGRITRLILGEGLTLTLAGLCIGSLAGLALTRLITTLLFDVGTGDPLTFIGAALLLVATGAAASYVPARRATRIDPSRALRAE